MAQISQETIKIVIDQAEAANSLKDLKQSIKDLKNAALEAGEGTEGFNQLVAKAGELQDKLNDVQDTTKALAGNIAENLTKSFGTMLQAGLGGFQAIAGAQAVFGEENKDLQKQLVKLQGLLALSNGIKEIANLGQAYKDFKTVITNVIAQVISLTTAKTSEAAAETASATATAADTVAKTADAAATEGATVAQIGLNAAMLANPVILLLAGITALVGALIYFTGKENEAIAASNELNKVLKERQQTLIDLGRDYAKLAFDIGYINGFITKSELEKTKNIIDSEKKRDEAIQKYAADYIKVSKLYVDDTEGRNKALIELENKYQQELRQIKGAAILANKGIDDQVAKDTLEAQRKLNEELKTLKAVNIESDILSEREQLKASYENQRDDLKKAAEKSKQDGIDIDTETNAILKQIKKKYYNDLEQLNFDYNQKLKTIEANQIKIDETNDFTKIESERKKLLILENIRFESAKKQAEGDKALSKLVLIENTNNIEKINKEAAKKNREAREEESKKINEFNQNVTDQKLANEANNRKLTQESLKEFQDEQTDELRRQQRRNHTNDEESISQRRALLKEQQEIEIKRAKETGAEINEINKIYYKKNDDLDAEAFEKKMQRQKEYQDLAVKSIEFISQTLNDISGLVAQKAQNDIKAIDDAANARSLKLQQDKDQGLVDLENQKNEELAIIESNQKTQLEGEFLSSDQKKEIQDTYNQQKKEAEKKAAIASYNLQKETAEAEYKNKLAAYNQETAIAKKAFDRDKAFRIANIAIGAAEGIALAIASLGKNPTPVGIAAATIASAAIATSAALNIAKIRGEKFDAGTPPQPPPPIAAPSFTDNDSDKTDKASPSNFTLFGSGGAKNNVGTGNANGERTINVVASVDVSQVTNQQNQVQQFELNSTLEE